MSFKTRQVRAFTRNLDLNLYKIGGGIGKWHSFLIFSSISQINKNDQRVSSNYEWVASSNNNKVQNQNGIKNLDVTLIWSWIKHYKLTNYKKSYFIYISCTITCHILTQRKENGLYQRSIPKVSMYLSIFYLFHFSQKG